jgi:Bacterial Ig-like domain (group 3)/MBG domain (YGX type)/Chitobiase/beta-hexosaminidase C-terminal domain/Bacterial Ig-like domain (group 1)/Beta-propeller repeat
MRAQMPKLILLLLAALTAMPALTQQQTQSPRPDDSRAVLPSKSAAQSAALIGNYGKLPLSFEANQGQVNSKVRFLSRGKGYSIFLTDREAVLALRSSGSSKTPSSAHGRSGARPALDPGHARTDVIRLRLAGARANLRVGSSDKLPGTANYFIGRDSAQWHTNLPTFGKVKYTGVYPGVDLIYYGNQQQLEYDFVVAPHADPAPIRLRFDGAEKLSLDPAGNLEIIARNGRIAFQKPIVYQEANGKRQRLQGAFTMVARNAVGFTLGNYDHSQPLIIDPTLAYSTYLGGAAEDGALAIAADSNGNAYIAGSTGSYDFPVTTGAFETSSSYKYSFVTKLNPAGAALVYSTYFDASVTALAIDAAGAVYLTGSDGNIPATTGAFQTANDGFTAFVAKLNPAGSALVYLTYLGGSSGQSTSATGTAIAVDSLGNAYVAGDAHTTNFPVTAGAFQTTNNAANGPYSVIAGNAFITKVNPTGTALVYSTFLGGAETDASGIAIDGSGNAYVTGYTISYDNPAASFDAVFPTTSDSFDPGETLGGGGNETLSTPIEGYGSFVTKLNPTGTVLVYSTFLGDGYLEAGGTTGDDTVGGPGNSAAIAVDSNGNAYVTGSTSSIDFPVTSGAFQAVNNATASGTSNAFISELNASGTALVYSTYLGGSTTANSTDGGLAIAVDASGDAYVAGQTSSTSFPVTADAYQSVNNAAAANTSNAFLTELNPAGSALIYSTYLGGNGDLYQNEVVNDKAHGIALDGNGGAYLAGQTGSTDFPVTTGAFQAAINPANTSGTAFVAKFSLGAAVSKIATSTSLASSANPQSAGESVTFTATVTPASGNGTPTGTVTFSVDGGAGTPVTLNSSGEASYSTSTLTVGTHTIQASYSGDSNYSASSASLSETITAATATAASIAVVSGSGQTTPYGSAFANPLVVIVKDASGNPVSGAVVSFSGSGLSFSSATATTGANGEASVTATATASGSLTASATTSGVTETANFSLTATKVALTVTAANVSVAYNQPIPALTYTVTGFVNGDAVSVLSGSPAETTTATQGSAVGAYPITIAQGTLSAANYTFSFVNATLTVSSLGTAATPTFSPAAGSYTSAQSVSIGDTTTGAIVYYTTNSTAPTASSAQYSAAIPVGTTETIEAIAVAPGYSNSAVATATYTINLPAPSFSFTSSPSSATISSGQSATITLTVTPSNGFTQAVSLDCSGLPTGYGCSFAPSTITPSGAAVNSKMTIASNTATSTSRPLLWSKAGAGLALALFLWPFARRKKGYRLAMLLLLAGAFALAGCVGSPASHNYTVSVSASGGGITKTLSIDLTVTQ